MAEERSVTQLREFSTRVARIRKLMRTQSIDAVYLTQPTNVWYVAGFWEFIPIRMEAVLVPADGDCVFIVSKNEFEYANKVSWINDVRYYTEFPEPARHQNPYDLMMDVFRDKHLEKASIGIEDHFYRWPNTGASPDSASSALRRRFGHPEPVPNDQIRL